MKFSEKLFQLRKKAGMSQEELAEQLEVSRQAISRWEMGTAMPDAPNLLRISTLFGISVDYLLHDSYESDNDTGYFYITFDGNYIWMDDEGYKNMAMYFNKQSNSLDYTLYQLDRDGMLVAKRTIPDEEKIFSIMHGDSRRMFMFSFVNNRIVYIDKSNIEKGDIKELR